MSTLTEPMTDPAQGEKLMKSAWKTDIGKKRENNEDSILVDEEQGIFLLADGMGGHAGGEIASGMAVTEIHRYIRERLGQVACEDIFRLMAEALAAAHSSIFKKSLSDAGLQGMGTTVDMAVVKDSRVFTCHVGDSRVYLLREEKLRKITSDDNVATWIRKYGHVQPKQIPPEANHLLTQAVGISEELIPEFHTLELQPGDIMIMCSDGLTEILDDEEIEAVLRQYRNNLDEAAAALVAEANARGGPDNISVVLMETKPLSPSMAERILLPLKYY